MQLGCKPSVIAQVMAAFEQASRGQMDVLVDSPEGAPSLDYRF